MQSTSFAFLALSICVYISCTFNAVYGKCSGRWAIHACYGGNGKRSGPPEPDTSSKIKERQYFLHQLLMSDKIPQTLPAESEFDSEPVLDDIESLYPDLSTSYRRRDPEIEKIKTLLGELLLKRQYQESLVDDFGYRR